MLYFGSQETTQWVSKSIWSNGQHDFFPKPKVALSKDLVYFNESNFEDTFCENASPEMFKPCCGLQLAG